ncbi:ead/Ea22-like family protein [Escherichia coli]
MSKIDYQVLREAAEKATCGEWSLEYGDGRFDGDDALIHREVAGYIPICRIEGAHPESGFDEDFQMEQQANAEFIAAANPATVLALLDELEGKDSKIANLTAERDALREGEMGDARHSNTRAAADIYFQLVEECEIPAGGSLVEYVDDMREKLEAAEKRIAELESGSQAQKLVEAIIVAIENEQERLFDEDYLMDSKECIDVIREEVKRWNDSRAAGIKEESE